MPERENEAVEIISLLKAREKEEPIASFLKTRLVELTPGYAMVTMKMIPEYQNFHNLTFGGIIMALADQAFGYASNSLAYPSVASQFNTYFIASARTGDELTAECNVIKSGKRAGISEVKITNQEGKIIAKSTGITVPVSRND